MLFGNKNEFAIELENVDTTERYMLMKLYIQNVNILEYSFDGKVYSLTGNIDELILYLDETINPTLMEIPFPFNVKGDSAIELDINARDYDSKNEDEFDAYYTQLNDWAFSHSWTHARDGLYIPDVMYRKINDTMEISWCGVGIYDGVEFSSPKGSYLINFNLYCSIINKVTKYYKENWLK